MNHNLTTDILPSAVPRTARIPVETTEKESYQKCSRILIVDDQEANIRLLEGLLRRAGYTQLVSTTYSCETLHLYDALQPDLILLDLMMPIMDGYEVMDQLQQMIPAGS